jgi:hypothetical protein
MRTTTIIISAALLIAAAARADLVTNRSFETGDFYGWSLFGSGWRIGTHAEAHAGSYGAAVDVFTNDVDNWRGIHQETPVSPGQIYWASAMIRAVGVESSASWLELQWRDAAGTLLRQDTTPFVTNDQPFRMAALSWWAAPAGAVTVSVRGIVHMIAPPAINSDTHIFDLFSFAAIDSGLLSNSSFETDSFTNWNTFGSGWRIGGGADARSGLYGAVNDVLVGHTASEQWRGLFQNVPVSTGAEYVFVGHVRAVNIESSRAFLEIQWLDSSGQIVLQEQSEHITGDQPFRRAVMDNLKPPANAVTASVRAIVFMENPPTTNDDFFIFDDLFFLPKSTLNVARGSGGQVLVSWTPGGAGRLVESTANLISSNWALVPEPPSLSTSGVWQVTAPGATSPAFFRLIFP